MSQSLTSFRLALGNRTLRLLEASWALALVSGWAYSLAIVAYTYDVGGAKLVGIALAIKIAPAVIAAPLIGALADHHSHRLILVISEAGLAVTAIAVGVLIAVDGPVAAVIAVGALMTILVTALRPAISAMLPSISEGPDQLTAANVLTSTIESLSIFVGPAIGGVVFTLTGSAALAAMTGVGFAASALVAAGLPKPADEVAQDPGPGGDEDSAGSPDSEISEGIVGETAAGFRALRGEPAIRDLLALMVAQTFVDGALGVLTAVAAIELLGMGSQGIGYLDAAVGVGAVLGSLAATGMVGGRLAPGFNAGLVLWGVPIAMLAVLQFPAAALILFAILGVGNILIDVAGMTLLQRIVPEELLARIFGVLEALTLAAVALGALVTPLLLELLGREAAFIAIGALLPLLALIAGRRVSRIDAAAAIPEEAIGLLRGLPLFAPLGPPVLEGLARQAEPTRVSAGDEVFRQGEPGDRFYVIVSGEAEVLIDGRRARLEGPGEHFGEIALLRETPRTATVRARTELELLSIAGQDFVAAVSGHSRSGEEAEAVIAARLAHMRPALATM